MFIPFNVTFDTPGVTMSPVFQFEAPLPSRTAPRPLISTSWFRMSGSSASPFALLYVPGVRLTVYRSFAMPFNLLKAPCSVAKGWAESPRLASFRAASAHEKLSNGRIIVRHRQDRCPPGLLPGSAIHRCQRSPSGSNPVHGV